MRQENKIKTITDMSKKELMDFIITLNKCMDDYDKDIEYRIKCSEKREFDSLETSTINHRLSKRIQYARSIKR